MAGVFLPVSAAAPSPHSRRLRAMSGRPFPWGENIAANYPVYVDMTRVDKGVRRGGNKGGEGC